ncbi:MAG: sigma 54-interacting transcriptional regulator [bacterium]
MALDPAEKSGRILSRIASLTHPDRDVASSADSSFELAELYFALDRYDDALGCAVRARSRVPAQETLSRLLLIEAWCRFHLGELAAASQTLLSIRFDSAHQSDPSISGRIDTLQSWIYLHNGDLNAAVSAADSALANLRNSSDHLAFGEALLALGRARLRAGETLLARDTFRDALASFRRAESLSGEGRAVTDIAIADKTLGRLRDAAERYHVAIAIAKDLGQSRFVMTRRHNLAVVLFHLGQIPASLAKAEAALNDALALGDAFVAMCARITCARGLIALGRDFDRARTLLDEALSIASTRGFRREEALANEFLGDLAWVRDDKAAAQIEWMRALAIIENVAPYGDVAGEALRRLAESRLAAGEVDEALEYARRAFRVTKLCGDRRENLVVLRVFGKIAAAQGRCSAARRSFEASAAGLESIGARRDLAETWVEIASAASHDFGTKSTERDEDCDAEGLLTRAAATFDELGLDVRAAAVRRLAGITVTSGATSLLVPSNSNEKTATPPHRAAAPAVFDSRRGAQSRTPAHITVRGTKGRRALLTQDPGFRSLLDRIAIVSKRAGAVLLLGETGTGKELLARLVHDASGRKGRFVAANVAAIPEGLVESELFGHVRGAFTGASEEKIGLLEAADGGTFFLDEIGDLPPAIQVKLLRLLDDSAVKRVGAIHDRIVDIRFVAATNRDLRRMVRDGAFRSDLFYRLSVHEISIPPLRERRGDVSLLAGHFLAKLAENEKVTAPALVPAALAALAAYNWPGNVRELQSEMERAYSAANGAASICMNDLSAWISSLPGDTEDAGVLRGEVAALERTRIQDALNRTGGNLARAADSLGVTPQALRYKIRKYGLLGERFRPADELRGESQST